MVATTPLSMKSISFLVHNSTEQQNDLQIQEQANEDIIYRYPVLRGVATEEQVENATMDELRLYMQMARMVDDIDNDKEVYSIRRGLSDEKR